MKNKLNDTVKQEISLTILELWFQIFSNSARLFMCVCVCNLDSTLNAIGPTLVGL